MYLFGNCLKLYTDNHVTEVFVMIMCYYVLNDSSVQQLSECKFNSIVYVLS